MKRFNYAIAIMLITLLVLTACNREGNLRPTVEVRTNGTLQQTATAEQTQIIDTEEGFSAGFDASYLLDGDLWFTAAGTGLKVAYVNQEILNQFENYVTFIDESAPLEPKIIFTSTNTIDLEYLAIRMEYNEAKGEFFLIEDASMASSIIRPNTPFVVNWMEAGLMPQRAVAFYDRNDVKRYFTISGNNSGEGAPVLLMERQAGTENHSGVAILANTSWRYESGNWIYFFGYHMAHFGDTSSISTYDESRQGSGRFDPVNTGSWNIEGNKLIVYADSGGMGGGGFTYTFTINITGNTITITDTDGDAAVFRKIDAQG